MPELAEVEIARRQLRAWWQGRRAERIIIHDAKLLDAERAERWLTTCLRQIERRGKHLILAFDEDRYALLHLRMTGKIVSGEERAPRGARLSVYFHDDAPPLHFVDTRRLGTLQLFRGHPRDQHEALRAMGPEPYDLPNGQALSSKISPKRRLKSALLDQKVLAGVGNIAISELFWQVGLHPEVLAGEVTAPQWQALVKAMPPYFDSLINAHPIEREIDYVNQGAERPVASPFQIYAHEGEPCPRCLKASIERVKVSGRSSYFCPSCQARSERRRS